VNCKLECFLLIGKQCMWMRDVKNTDDSRYARENKLLLIVPTTEPFGETVQGIGVTWGT
jgi:hypothetical protein